MAAAKPVAVVPKESQKSAPWFNGEPMGKTALLASAILNQGPLSCGTPAAGTIAYPSLQERMDAEKVEAEAMAQEIMESDMDAALFEAEATIRELSMRNQAEAAGFGQPLAPSSRVEGLEDLASFREGILATHNSLRALHGVPDLQWSENLAIGAQLQANECAKHQMLFHGNNVGQGQNVCVPAFRVGVLLLRAGVLC